MLTRRNLIGRVAAGAAVIVTSGVARASYRKGERLWTAPTNSGPNGLPVDGPAPSLVTKHEPTAIDNPGLSGARSEAAPAAATSDATPPPWELIRPLKVGSTVAYGWRVADLTGAVDGSAVITLQNLRGRTHRVHICRNDGRPQGLVYTPRFDLVVMNGGRGDLPTEEGFARAVAELGHVLATNENDPQHRPIVAALLPQAERLRLFDDARLR